MEKKWEEMSAGEKREARFATWLSAEGIQFQSPEAEASYKASINSHIGDVHNIIIFNRETRNMIATLPDL